jgi:hypothetical protein
MLVPTGADTASMETNNATKITKPIEIFKPGSFTAVNGERYTFSPADVAELAASYDPNTSDAPFVVGHPKLTSPRFGHVGSLSVNSAGVLCAIPANVVPEFAEAVNAGYYPKVSASIFLPSAPGNPTPGKHYLRHVGFLGGAAPAVKGLQSVEFSASTEGVAEFGYEDKMIVGLFRSLRDWMIDKFGLEQAQSVLPDYSLDTLNSIADSTQDPSLPLPAFSDPHTQEDDLTTAAAQKNLDEQTAALAAQQKALNDATVALLAREAKIRKTEFADFAEGLCKEGKLIPAQKASVVEILSQLDSANQIADFAAGDENHGKTGAELFKQFLSVQPKQVEFDRITKDSSAKATIASFAAPAGEHVDQEGLAELAAVNAYMAENKGVDFISAVRAVRSA